MTNEPVTGEERCPECGSVVTFVDDCRDADERCPECGKGFKTMADQNVTISDENEDAMAGDWEQVGRLSPHRSYEIDIDECPCRACTRTRSAEQALRDAEARHAENQFFREEIVALRRELGQTRLQVSDAFTKGERALLAVMADRDRHAAEVAALRKLADDLDVMSEAEGIVWIKGHGGGPEVGCELSWDRLGQPIMAFADSLTDPSERIPETIAKLRAIWDKKRDQLDTGTYQSTESERVWVNVGAMKEEVAALRERCARLREYASCLEGTLYARLDRDISDTKRLIERDRKFVGLQPGDLDAPPTEDAG